jgi:hypothetical protein
MAVARAQSEGDIRVVKLAMGKFFSELVLNSNEVTSSDLGI